MDQERTQLGRRGELIKSKDRKGRKRNTGSGCHQRLTSRDLMSEITKVTLYADCFVSGAQGEFRGEMERTKEERQSLGLKQWMPRSNWTEVLTSKSQLVDV